MLDTWTRYATTDGQPFGPVEFRRAREAAGFSVGELAAKTWTVPETIGGWESGKRLPLPRTLARVLRVLGLLNSVQVIPMTARKRTRRQKFPPLTVDEAKELAMAVLEQAIHDWKEPCEQARDDVGQLGYKTVRGELRAFLGDSWCESLLELVGCGEMDLLTLLKKAEEA